MRPFWRTFWHFVAGILTGGLWWAWLLIRFITK